MNCKQILSQMYHIALYQMPSIMYNNSLIDNRLIHGAKT